jgi:hypothetical protein
MPEGRQPRLGLINVLPKALGLASKISDHEFRKLQSKRKKKDRSQVTKTIPNTEMWGELAGMNVPQLLKHYEKVGYPTIFDLFGGK